MDDRPTDQANTPTANSLARQYEELMRQAPPALIMPALEHRNAIWASMIPRVVPSVATYGAYEKPL